MWGKLGEVSLLSDTLRRVLIEHGDRYNDLYVTGKTVNVRYSADGEFKVSGSYGTYERRFAAME